MVRQTLEGTWEEITRHAAELAGRRVRLTILDDVTNAHTSFPPGTSLAEAMKDCIGKIKSGKPHNDSERVEELWSEHVIEKHRKQERRA